MPCWGGGLSISQHRGSAGSYKALRGQGPTDPRPQASTGMSQSGPCFRVSGYPSWGPDLRRPAWASIQTPGAGALSSRPQLEMGFPFRPKRPVVLTLSLSLLVNGVGLPYPSAGPSVQLSSQPTAPFTHLSPHTSELLPPPGMVSQGTLDEIQQLGLHLVLGTTCTSHTKDGGPFTCQWWVRYRNPLLRSMSTGLL